MEHPEMEEDGRMSGPPDDRLSEMDQEDMIGGVGGRDSPIKPTGGMEVGEDILAKLRQQVSAATLFGGHHPNHLLGANNGTPTPGSPNAYPPPHNPTHLHNNNNINNGHNIYDRIQSLLQAKMKRDAEEGGDFEDDPRDLALRAEAIQRQRETLLSSPHTLMNAMRAAPHHLLHPASHIPFLPTTVGLPPSSQMPPTPGSAGSRDSSSGNGNRTPSHTPEPSQSQSWGFDDQFKQARGDDYGIPDTADSPRVREPAKHSSFEDDKRKLYELSSDSKRKDFLDELFGFMQKRGTPINRLPIMAKQVLDLYELYNLVVERGGLVDVINKKLWQEIIKGLKLPSSITSAAFTLRTQYMKYLYPFECEKKSFSNPAELQCAIDGNRREGRRSSYGTYGDMGGQPPLLPLQNFQNFQGLQNPLGLVSRPQLNGNGMVSQDLLLGRGGSPPGSQEALLEATRLTMWKLYNQGLGGSLGGGGGGGGPDDDGPRLPPPHLSMGGGGGPTIPPQKEALNLDVKDDPISDPWMNFPRPRNKDSGEFRHNSSSSKSDEGNNQPPSAKRPHDEPLNQRLPTPNGGSSTSLSVPGANIKITSRGDGRGQDQSLVVSMEINGILYQGVLFAQTPRASPRFS